MLTLLSLVLNKHNWVQQLLYLWYRELPSKINLIEKILVKQARSKDSHDGNAKELRSLSKGQELLFELNPDDSKAQWSKGAILHRNDRSYTVKFQTGCVIVRNRVNLRQFKIRQTMYTSKATSIK